MEHKAFKGHATRHLASTLEEARAARTAAEGALARERRAIESELRALGGARADVTGSASADS